MLLCTGKIGHELAAEREARKDGKTAIVFLDQLYPFPNDELVAELARHPGARQYIWVQEEPANMGALPFVHNHLRLLAGDHAQVRSIKRSASASPATSRSGR